MELKLKNITITEKHVFNFMAIAMMLTLFFQLYLKFIAKVEVNFTPIILTSSMLVLWCYFSKSENPKKG